MVTKEEEEERGGSGGLEIKLIRQFGCPIERETQLEQGHGMAQLATLLLFLLFFALFNQLQLFLLLLVNFSKKDRKRDFPLKF